IVNMWNRSETPNAIIEGYRNDLNDLPGYPLEYIIHALNWILEQEDANFTGRPPRRQEELDEVMKRFGIFTPRGREGSQLAVSHFCNIASGMHPVEALMRANLDILPIKRSRGSV
ncbi:MAG: hypothetical protein N3H84_08820, partial [Candidatus Caldarchaeum sp.]|nr:hypothetical protein [Candidatus Caldarchaeum sp.]